MIVNLCTWLLVVSTVIVTFTLPQPGAASQTALPASDAPAKSASLPPEPATGLRVLASEARSVTLELVTPDFRTAAATDDLGACTQIIVDGYSSTADSGKPALPVKGTMVGIPAGAEVTLTVLEADFVEQPGKYTICPVARPIVEPGPEDTLTYQGQALVRDAAAYATAGFAPVESAVVLTTGFVRSQRVAEVQFRPFQYNPITGQLRFARRIRVQLSFTTAPQRLSGQPATENVDEGAFEDVLRSTVLNYADARAWRVAAPRLPSTPAVQAPLSTSAYKILVDADGIYQLTYDALLAAGVPVGSLDPRTLQLHTQGNQVALYVAGEADGVFNTDDYVLFYGQKMTTRYTDVNVYWLTWGGANGLRMGTSNGTPGGAAVPAYYQTTQRIEVNRLYQSYRPSGPDNDRWYWTALLATKPATVTMSFILPYPVTTSTSATFSGILRSYDADPHHHTRVYLNGLLLDDAIWPVNTERSFTATLPQSALISGTNTIHVVAPADGGITRDYSFINRFEITYNRYYVAVGDTLMFSGDTAGTWEYRVDGFTTNAVDVFDVSTPTTPVLIQNVNVVPTGSTYRLIFQQSIPAARRYFALTPAQRKSPKAIVADVPSDLRAMTNGADYIFITHPDFVTAIQPLADYHASRGLRTVVVDVTEIYDTFNYGIFDPEAIRSFLAYAYTSWARPAPTYVLLVGDGNYDFKNYTGRGEPVYIPPYLADVDPWMGETAADNRYVAVSGSDILPDMHLGRFPVKTAAETTAMVNKTLDYMQNPPTTEWNRQILFLADNPDAAGDFYAYSDAVADSYVPPFYNAQKVYYLRTHGSASAVRAALFNAINEGRLMINYVGHGAYLYWANEKFLQTADMSLINNPGKLAFFVPMTCWEGYYIYPSGPGQNFSSVAETLVRAANKGSIAGWSPTGLGLASGHDIMNRRLYQAILYENVITVGPATTLGKLAMAGQGHDELIETFTLFGDPALPLNVPKADLRITKTAQVTPPDALIPEAITYTLTYSNAGPSTAYSVVITDILPSGLENPVAVSSGAAITPRPGTTYVWDVANLPNGAGGVITITATVSPTFRGTLDNRAAIASQVLDLQPGNNTSSTRTDVGLGPTATISRSGNDIVLAWNAVPGAAQYRVHRSTYAYFTPVTATALVTQTALTYTDPGAIGNPAVNYFYAVTALDAQGQETSVVNRVGEFDFALLPGAAGAPWGRYNIIALPLDVTAQLPNAKALANYLGTGVQQVLSWNPDTQTFRAWLPPINRGNNFVLTPGGVYWIQLDSTATTLISFVGTVPQQGSVKWSFAGATPNCRLYDISLPLDQTGIARATQLATAIGPNVEQVLEWNPTTQTFKAWLPQIGRGNNFVVKVGYPYHVCFSPGAPIVWP
ncbi:MAG TPA: C25 family cysteine peptidase [Anaerolineae bacterium]|nr:C25 family cysteine peptidase [Anaerolineae bacterium]HQK13194.1 C25 family cysteine peptidase [Anaerolineae bacterium]